MRLVFHHVLTAYGEDGESAFTVSIDFYPGMKRPDYTGAIDVKRIADNVIAHIHNDTALAAPVAAQFGAADVKGLRQVRLHGHLV